VAARTRTLAAILLATAAAIVLAHEITRGMQRLPQPAAQMRKLLPRVELFLARRAGNEVTPGVGPTRWVCGVRYLGNSPPRGTFDLYVWAYCQSYGHHGNELTPGTAWSVPAVIDLRRTKGSYEPIGEREPGDDEQFGIDVERMFPPETARLIPRLESHGPGIDLDARARLAFGLH
jgi:hypothetical protein